MDKLPTHIDRLVSRRLLARRTELNLRQEDLAEQLGVTYQQFQKYEQGRNRISAGRLYQLARALDVGIPYFFAGAETVSHAVARGLAEEGADFVGFPDNEAIDLMLAFEKIGPRQRKAILTDVKRQTKEQG